MKLALPPARALRNGAAAPPPTWDADLIQTPISRPPRSAALALAAALATLSGGAAMADKIKHPVAVFAGLDKITGRIMPFDVAIDETVQFGALQVTPRACFTRPPTEAPLTDAFIEVDDIGSGKASDYKRIFSGWMFAASPGLHGVEHPVYDVWLTDCKGGKEIIKEAPAVASAGGLSDLDEPIRQPKPGTVPRPRPAPSAAAQANLPPPIPAQPRQPSRSFFPTNAGPARDIVNSR